MLSAGLAPTAQSATVKAGAKCVTVGKIVREGNTQLQCKRVGTKRIWVKVASRPKPATVSPSPSASPSPSIAAPVAYQEPAAPSDALALCQIQEVNQAGNSIGALGSGYPRKAMELHRDGILRMALIPVDWADLPGEARPVERVRDDMTMFSDWYATVSGGKLKVEWQVHETWIRVPGPSADFAIKNSSRETQDMMKGFGSRLVAASDAAVDFTNVDAVAFLLPRGQTIVGGSAQSFPFILPGGGYQTNEGLVRHFSAAGTHFDQLGRNYWAYWAHEAGHFLRIAHVGSSFKWSDMHGFDLMGAQDGPLRSLNAWLRLLRGWLDDTQVHCRDLASLQPTTAMLAPLDSASTKLKAVLVRVDAEHVVIVEARRTTKFDCAVSGRAQGVLVYSYDARKHDQEEYLQPVRPEGRFGMGSPCPAQPVPDALMGPGDSVTALGVKVTVLASHDYDEVRIERA